MLFLQGADFLSAARVPLPREHKVAKLEGAVPLWTPSRPHPEVFQNPPSSPLDYPTGTPGSFGPSHFTSASPEATPHLRRLRVSRVDPPERPSGAWSAGSSPNGFAHRPPPVHGRRAHPPGLNRRGGRVLGGLFWGCV